WAGNADLLVDPHRLGDLGADGVDGGEGTFDIDANGIVNVSAKDLGTGKEQTMTITGGSALPKDDIARMMREAESYAEEDKRRREEAETRNNADSLVYQTEKFLSENSDKVPDDVKTEVNDSVAELKKALEGTDTAAIRTAAEKLATVSQKMGSAIYAQSQGSEAAGAAAGAGAEGAAGQKADEDVVEAEIVDEEPKRDNGAK
ncbi:Hsp70 family protein, partial [Streptosporangium sandarakinum]